METRLRQELHRMAEAYSGREVIFPGSEGKTKANTERKTHPIHSNANTVTRPMNSSSFS